MSNLDLPSNADYFCSMSKTANLYYWLGATGVSAGVIVITNFALLLENSDFLLLEDGFKLLLD